MRILVWCLYVFVLVGILTMNLPISDRFFGCGIWSFICFLFVLLTK